MSVSETTPRRSAGIDGVEAWTRSLSSPASVWLAQDTASGESVEERLGRGLLLTDFEPKFELRDDDVFFCMGSCFVRAIEECLLCRDLQVSSIGMRVPLDEALYRLNGFLNKFTAASMHNELLWSLAGVPFPEDALLHDGTLYHDLQLAYLLPPVSLERARRRRAEVQEYFARLRDATVVIVTLGLAEVWYDHVTGLCLNVTPPRELVTRHPGRFTVDLTGYAENRAHLEAIYELLKRYGRPDVRLIVTVSPIPVHRTFVAADATVANTYGKAALRAAAGDFVRDKDDAEYYPSYEMVTLTDRCIAYERDQLHVDYGVVRGITEDFLRRFRIGRDAPNAAFREEWYLRANPDVRAAVAELRFRSGYEHWLRHGRAEGRPLAP